MAARTIDGKAVAARRRGELAARVDGLRSSGTVPCLVALGVDDDPGWKVYQRNQRRLCDEVGILHREERLAPDAGQDGLLAQVETLNADSRVHGIILQSPLPEPYQAFAAQALISPAKDVEAVGPANLGLMLADRATLAPCTALAAFELAREVLPDLRGVEAVVVGHSVIVGRPVAQLLLGAGATVTNCHVDTRELAAHTRRAELLIVAVGRPGLITAEMVAPGATVIDVGINRIENGGGNGSKVVGDVDPGVADTAGALTPVPGGVGSLTTTLLLEATVAAAEQQRRAAGAVSGTAIGKLFARLGVDLSPEAGERVAALLSRHLVASPDLEDLLPGVERQLGRRVLVFDGGVGTALMEQGVAAGDLDRANVEEPAKVLAVHRAYAATGVDVLTTNTFGINRLRYDGEEAERLARAGVRLARQAASGNAFVFASIGPFGKIPGVEIPVAEVEDAAAELGLAMLDAGADGFLVETMVGTAEAAAIVRGLRRLGRATILCSRTIDRDDPIELAEFAAAAEAAGANAVGLNCSNGPRRLRAPLRSLAAASRLPVFAMPNAGYPGYDAGRPVYELDPGYLVAQTRDYCAAGAAIVGGCCGVHAEHVAALVESFRGIPVKERPRLTPPPADEPESPRAEHPYLDALSTGTFPVLVSVPGRLGPGESRAALETAARAGADAIGLVTGWPGGERDALRARTTARLRNLADVCRVPAVLELPAGTLELREAQATLLNAHLLGIGAVLIDDGVFAGAGDHHGTRHGLGAGALCDLVAKLNRGRDLAGDRLEEPTAFVCGVRVDADGLPGAAAYRDRGAHWIELAPVYDHARFRHLMAGWELDLPLVSSVLVLPDAETAEELDNEVPAISVPRRLRDRLREHPEEDLEGVLRFLHHWRRRLAGVHLILPDRRADAAAAILGALGKTAA